MRNPVFVLAILPLIVWAGQVQGQPTTQPEPIELRIHPMAVAEPALRDRLLPSPGEQTPGNAAPLYSNAFTFVQSNFDSWQPKQSEEFDQLSDAAIDDLDVQKAASFDSPSAMQLLELASRRTRCEWDTSLREQGYHALLPQLNYARAAANLLSLQIKLDIRKGDDDRAITRLRAGFAMANHLEAEPILVQCLVAAGIRELMMTDVRALVQRPNAPNLYWPLANLQGSGNLWPGIMASEREALFYTFPELRHPEDLTAEKARKLLDEIASYIDSSPREPRGHHSGRTRTILQTISAYPKARRFVILRGVPADRVEAMPANAVALAWFVDGYERRADAMERWTGLPPWQALAGLRRELRVHRDDDELNPLKQLFPSIGRAYLVLAGGARERAMLQLVEGIRAYAAAHGGAAPPTLEEFPADAPAPPDPLLGRPFDYHVDHAAVTLHAAAPPTEDTRSELIWHIQIEQ